MSAAGFLHSHIRSQMTREEIIFWEKNLCLHFPNQIHDFCVIGQFYFTKHKLLLACKLQTSLTSFEFANSEAFCCALIMMTLKELFFDGILCEAFLLKQVKTCALKDGVCILINTETQWINLCIALRGSSWYGITFSAWKTLHLQGIEAQQWCGACGCAWKFKSVLSTCVFP